MNGNEVKRCGMCKCTILISYFEKNRKGEYNKSCSGCLEKQRQKRKESKCEHGRIRSTCKECGGTSICEHGRQRSTCKECGGTSVSEQGRIRSQCITCNPKRACQNCFQVYVDPKYRFKPYCFRCYCVLNPDVDIPRKYMIKEHHLRDALREEYKNTELIFNKKVEGGCSLKRPDVRIECYTHTIVIECDEEQHKNTSCEEKRMMEIFQDLGSRPLVLLRFNPDKYDDQEGCFKTTKAGGLSLNKKEWNERIKLLIEKIDLHLKKVPEKEIIVEHFFYNQE